MRLRIAEAQIKALLRAGRHVNEISKMVGVSSRIVMNRKNELGLTRPTKAKVRLSDHDRFLVSELRKEGLTVAEISEKFEISLQTTRNIINKVQK